MRLSTVLRPLAIATAAILLLLTTAGCGGKDPGRATSGARPTGKTTTGAAGPKIGDSASLGKSFWHAGWRVDLGTATIVEPPLGFATPVVRVEVILTNLGTESAHFDSDLTLASNGRSYPAHPALTRLPQVPGAAHESGLIGFPVGSTFTLADAVLTVGDSKDNQAVVPFGATGTAQPREPVAQPVKLTGALAFTFRNRASSLAISVTGVELRADLPDRHREVAKGQLALVLTYSITYTHPDIYSYFWLDQNLLLQLPDGTIASPDKVSSVPNIKPGATVPDLTARFLVKDPAAGAYQLIIRSHDGPEQRVALPFQL